MTLLLSPGQAMGRPVPTNPHHYSSGQLEPQVPVWSPAPRRGLANLRNPHNLDSIHLRSHKKETLSINFGTDWTSIEHDYIIFCTQFNIMQLHSYY